MGKQLGSARFPRSLVGDVVLRGGVHSVEEALDRMRELTAYLIEHSPRGADDGLACFNHLYTIITSRVFRGIHTGFFADPTYMTQLDIDFANRYFDALRTYASQPSRTPRAWKVLLDRRDSTRIHPMQFAIAGVNAHVNLDLGVAVVMSSTALRTHPTHGHQHADYLRINEIFAEEMQGLRQHYETPQERRVDELFVDALNAIGDWSVVLARSGAWKMALELWDAQRVPGRVDEVIELMDRNAAFLGYALLVPLRMGKRDGEYGSQ